MSGDGIFVGKNPDDCDNFLPCPDLQLTPTPINQDNLTPTPTPDPDATPTPTDKLDRCDDIEKVCSDGSVVTPDKFNNCGFPSCPDDDKCNDDLLLCPNGQYVGRDPNTCDFLPCPGVTWWFDALDSNNTNRRGWNSLPTIGCRGLLQQEEP